MTTMGWHTPMHLALGTYISIAHSKYPYMFSWRRFIITPSKDPLHSARFLFLGSPTYLPFPRPSISTQEMVGKTVLCFSTPRAPSRSRKTKLASCLTRSAMSAILLWLYRDTDSNYLTPPSSSSVRSPAWVRSIGERIPSRDENT